MSNLVKKLSMVILLEHELEPAVNFYTKLGFKPVFHLKDKWAEFNLDNVTVGLCPIDQKFDDFRTGFVFQIDDLITFYNENKNNYKFLDEPFEAVHGIMVSIKDPGGNIIDLYQPTPEKMKTYVQQMAQEGTCCKKDKSKECSCDSQRKSPLNPESCPENSFSA
jgi:hypothetical protein